MLAVPLAAWGPSRAVLGLGLAVALTSCGTYGILPAPTRTDRIHEATVVERKRCTSEPIDPRVYSADDVESVAPLLFFVQTGNNREARLAGAELRLRPLPSMTPDLLAYSLSCRSAQLVLGRVQGAENEPYWLPDGWVKISARSDDGALVVALEGEDFPQSKEILARAQAFAASAKGNH
jgi:hypothetical protein